MLRYRLRFSTGRAFAIPTGQSKTRMTVMTLRSCARTFIAGPTMSIIESLLVLWRLAARAKQSAPSGGNGRRVISVDRPLRLRTAPRERPGCSPASLPPEGTAWPFSRCIGPDGPPVGGVQQLRLPWFSRKMLHLASGPERGVSGAAGAASEDDLDVRVLVRPVLECMEAVPGHEGELERHEGDHGGQRLGGAKQHFYSSCGATPVP